MISEKDIEDWLHYELKEIQQEMEKRYWQFSNSLCTNEELKHSYNKSLGQITRILKRLNDINSNREL